MPEASYHPENAYNNHATRVLKLHGERRVSEDRLIEGAILSKPHRSSGRPEASAEFRVVLSGFLGLTSIIAVPMLVAQTLLRLIGIRSRRDSKNCGFAGIPSQPRLAAAAESVFACDGLC